MSIEVIDDGAATILYNDNDENCCAWLKALIAANEIPYGDVWCRSITDIQPDELKQYVQCHFFAGIGGWARALALAGVSTSTPLWTGSCPCPPFSSAAKKKVCPVCGGRPFPCPWLTGYFTCGECDHSWLADARHLWPEFWRLIAQCRPPVVLGEQVASDDGLIWFAGVRATLEMAGYGAGACDYPAAGVAAPNLRQRIFWVADSTGNGTRDHESERGGRTTTITESHGSVGGLEHPSRNRREQRGTEPVGRSVESRCESVRLGHPHDPRPQGQCKRRDGSGERTAGPSGVGIGASGFWDDYTITPCGDGKQRRIERGVKPLVDGLSRVLVRGGDQGASSDEVTEAEANKTAEGRIMRLRGYGNSINPYVAARFIQAAMGSGGGLT